MEPSDDSADARDDLRSFGRRRGRKLSPRQQRLLADLLPSVRVDLKTPLLSIPADQSRELWLEIGFGGGEHLVWQAEQNPGVRLIGCEPFEEGVVKVLAAIEDRGLRNILLHPDDARPLLRSLPAASITRAFVLFPDPWPKKRHVKRRLVSAQMLDLLARVMTPESELRIGTDIGDYARTMLIAFAAQPQFRWLADGPAAWRDQPSDWPMTRYQEKAIREGRRCYFLRFERL